MKKHTTFWNNFLKIVIVLTASLWLASCQKQIKEKQEFKKESVPIHPEREAYRNRFEQMAMISMAVFTENPYLMSKFQKSIIEKRKANAALEEGISFEEMVKNKPYVDKTLANSFIAKYKQKFYSRQYHNASKFSLLTDTIIQQIQKTSSNLRTAGFDNEDEAMFMTEYGCMVYFPYSENFEELSKLNPWITYDPCDNVQNVDVYRTENGVVNQLNVGGEWAETNPCLVLRFDINSENYPPLSPDANVDFIAEKDNTNLSPYENFEHGGTSGQPEPPPPPVVTCNDITQNLFPFLNDDYFISTSIPKIRLVDNVRSGFWSGSNVISLYQANGLIINATAAANDPIAAIKDTARFVDEVSIKRKKAKNQTWVEFGQIWNPHWEMVQKDNYMVFLHRRSWLSFDNLEIKYRFDASIKYDTVLHRWVPNFNASASGDGKIKVGVRWRLQGEDRIPRASILANAVGDNFALGTTCTQNIYSPSCFTIRQCGKVQYYFKTNICY